MRQLIIQAPRQHAQDITRAAHAVDAVNLARWHAHDEEKELAVVLLHVGNAAVEPLLARLSELPDLRVNFLPSGAIALYPPRSRASEQVRDVELRSPIEVFLSGLQSIGSWRGFLSYAAASGVVVWIGLLTNTSYLLVAAMLLAPFAGPAMNAAVATARGDRVLLARSVLRYLVAIAVAILVSALLSLVFAQDIVSRLALDASQVSAVSVLLPLAAGAAGATQLIQSDRSSLVSGAAVGMLVAASLAPPAGIIGVSIALARADLIYSGLFLILLQFAGIHLAATLVFRLHGLHQRGPRYDRGTRRVYVISSALTALVLAAMLVLQFSGSPTLQRSSAAQRATAEIRQGLAGDPSFQVVRAESTFTRAELPGPDTLLCILHVQRQPDAPPADVLRARLTRQVQSLLLRGGYNVTPLVDVTVLELPPSMQ